MIERYESFYLGRLWLVPVSMSAMLMIDESRILSPLQFAAAW